jgi:ATP-dependent RNA helicase DHX37/DHR1
MVLIRAVGAAEYGGVTQEFCDRYALRFKAMIEIRKLRRQLTNEVNVVCFTQLETSTLIINLRFAQIMPDLNLALDPTLKPPTDLQSKLLRQILLSGLPDQVVFNNLIFIIFYLLHGNFYNFQIAKRVDEHEIKEGEDKQKYRYAYLCPEMEEPIYLHETCVLR